MPVRNPDFAALESQYGIYFPPEAVGFYDDAWRHNFNMALDAQPSLITTGNSGIPSWLTTYQDPKQIEVLLAPLAGAEIVGESQKGSWLDETAMFTVIEKTGETSSYGDYSENGSVGVNFQFPQRQSYLYQTITQYGEREVERAGLAKIDYVSRLNASSAWTLNSFQNTSYFYGIDGLANYGLLNDPSLVANLTPSTKAGGGTAWFKTNGLPNATANEVYDDIQSLFSNIVLRAKGVVDADRVELTLAMSPQSKLALNFANTFNVSVRTLLETNFPKIKFKTAQQYATLAGTPTATGNMVQLFVDSIDGQETATVAYNVKMKAHAMVTKLSSWAQKKTQGTWGAIIFEPFAIQGMIGV